MALAESQMSGAQIEALQTILSGHAGRIGPPTKAILRCPQLALTKQAMGDYIKSLHSLKKHIKELVILMVARHWTAQYEWSLHSKAAMDAGLPRPLVECIARGELPVDMAPDVRSAYCFCQELLHTRQVSDATYASAADAFGEEGIVDMIGIAGYYTLVSMILNVAQIPAPPCSEAPVLMADLPQGAGQNGPSGNA